jgi:hypothetical protein
MAQPESEDRPAAADDSPIENDEPDEPPRGDRPRRAPVDEPPIRRNPPRDWAAPPPWASGAAGSTGTSRRPTGAEPTWAPGFLAERADESRGLAGSAADRLAGAGSTTDPAGVGGPAAFDAAAAAAPSGDDELAGLVSARPTGERPASDYLPPGRSTRRPSVSSTRASSREREREHDAVVVGPSWERARRFEAYPTIRSRAGLPSLPRLAVLTVALAVAALALFFLPALLGVGGGGGGTATSSSPSASEGATSSASVAPTTPPAPTPQVYVVVANDTMSKIAKKFGFTLAELCAANQDTIPNCDKIAVGDEIVIPSKPPDEFTEPSASPSAEPS